MIMMGLRASPRSTILTQRMNETMVPRKKALPIKLTLLLLDNPAHSKFDTVTKFRRVYFDYISTRYVMFGVVHAITGVQDIHS